MDSTRAFHCKVESLMTPTYRSFSIVFRLRTFFMSYCSTIPSILVWCLIPVESNGHIPAFSLVVPFLVASWEIHHGTYIENHVVGHDTPSKTEYMGYCTLQKDLFSV